MKNQKGKFIVLYGINNLGKTTQAKMLVNYFNKKNIKAEYIKYAIYDLEPAGKLINEYLRNGNPRNFSPREFQILQYINKINFENILKEKLDNGISIIAEDYTGTSIAWGAGAGVDMEFLEYLYSFIYKEDLAILFDGERFTDSIEKNHKHENNSVLIDKVRQVHLVLAEKYNWKKINANETINEIHNNIVKIIEKEIF
ncbi:MAG: hypothetical protein KAI57_03905 [Candidatus Pacebacteria bacterium]|nr:hypothetical protein [Candidatus Paceibacterota bacterium]